MTSRKTSEADSAATGRRGKKKPLAVGMVLVLIAAGYFLVLRSPTPSAPVDAAPVPGAVVVLAPITINLAGGQFLRVGLGLQLAQGTSLADDDGGEESEAATPATPASTKADGAKALDAAINLFSGKTRRELSGPGRSRARNRLVQALAEPYHGAVMDVYFTDFVIQ